MKFTLKPGVHLDMLRTSASTSRVTYVYYVYYVCCRSLPLPARARRRRKRARVLPCAPVYI